MDTVGARIRKIRELRGLSQKAAAQKAGIHVVLFRRYEAGDRNPKPDQIEKIAQALEVEPSIFHIPKCEFLPAMLYNLMIQAGDFHIEQIGDSFCIGVQGNEYAQLKWNQALSAAKSRKDSMSRDEFQNWLMTCTGSDIYLEELRQIKRKSDTQELSENTDRES